MAVSAEERWHVAQIIDNLRINHPLTYESTYDQCMRFFKSIDKVNVDILAEFKGALNFTVASGNFAIVGHGSFSRSIDENDLKVISTGVINLTSSNSSFSLTSGAQ